MAMMLAGDDRANSYRDLVRGTRHPPMTCGEETYEDGKNKEVLAPGPRRVEKRGVERGEEWN